jgi:ABC-type spermidine/putrescine transport system permease subunit II
MHSTLLTVAIVAATVLIHISFVDFRFRYRDGVRWFWLLLPAPPLMWAARGTFIVALLVALSALFVGVTKSYALLLGGLMAAHIVSLILLEVLEPR